MNRAVSITLLLLLSFQFFFKAGIAGYYLANKAYIAKVLCINKDNIPMQCNGKCYLMQKMKAAENTKQETTFNIKYEPVEFLTSGNITSYVFNAPADESSMVSYLNNYHFQFCSLAFQPPC